MSPETILQSALHWTARMTSSLVAETQCPCSMHFNSSLSEFLGAWAGQLGAPLVPPARKPIPSRCVWGCSRN